MHKKWKRTDYFSSLYSDRQADELCLVLPEPTIHLAGFVLLNVLLNYFARNYRPSNFQAINGCKNI